MTELSSSSTQPQPAVASTSSASVLSLLGRHAPEALVALGGAGPRTAADLRVDAAAVAAALAVRGADPGQDDTGGADMGRDDMGRPQVVVICADRYLFAVGLLGAWRAGCAVVLPPNGRPATVAACEARTAAVALLHDTDASHGLDLRTLLQRPDSRGFSSSMAPASAGVVLTAFTSGSGGQAQACTKTTLQLLSEVTCLAETFGIMPGDRLLATVPPHHLYGLLFSVLLPLASGAVFCRETPLHAETVAARARACAATHLVSVPAHVRGLTLLGAGQLGRLRGLFSSTAPLPAETAVAVRRLHGLATLEILGSTETGGIAWRRRGELGELGSLVSSTAASSTATSITAAGVAPETQNLPCWRPLSAVRVSASSEGQLYVDSPFLPPEAPRPMATQDRVQFDAGGGFQHLGRLDAVVKVAGKRLSLTQLRSKLLALPGVTDAEVIALKAAGARGVRVWAAVAGETLSDSRDGRAQLRAGLRRWFEPAQLPRRICIVARLPREATGKLPRARMLGLFAAGEAASAAGDPVAASRPARPRRLTVVAHEASAGDEERRRDERHTFELTVPADFAWFDGHFPGRPILPGISTLHDVVLAQVLSLRPELGAPSGVDNLKFRRVVGPGARLRLTLVFKSPRAASDAVPTPDSGPTSSRVDFQIHEGEELCASGRLLFGGFA